MALLAALSVLLSATAVSSTLERPAEERSVTLTVGLHAGATASRWQGAPIAPAAGWGGYARVGLGRRSGLLGVDVELSAANLLLSGYVRGAAAVRLSPTRWLTFAAGPVVGETFFLVVGPEATYLGLTARVELSVLRVQGRDLTLGVAADLGTTVRASRGYSGPGASWGAFALVGFALL